MTREERLQIKMQLTPESFEKYQSEIDTLMHGFEPDLSDGSSVKITYNFSPHTSVA